MSKTALITGTTGQDGSYLSELLISKGYEVHGLRRRVSTPNIGRLRDVHKEVHTEGNKFFLHYGDLQDSSSITNLCYEIKPDEIYNLGAQSHVKTSFEVPEQTGNVTGLSTVRILESIRKSGIKTRFYQAASSEMFGSAPPPQNELTKFHPRSPYAVAKLYSYWITINYRESYGMYACNGILFNHESPRRGGAFVTRKITESLSWLLLGKLKTLHLGNLESKRDWGFAPEYVEAMHLMLQQDEPDDYVVGTGEAHSVRDFLETALAYIGINLEWQGEGLEKKGVISSFSSSFNYDSPLKVGDKIIAIDPYYFRPAEVDYLLADISKAKKQLKWTPKIKFDGLVKIMMDFDLRQNGLEPIGAGIELLNRNGFHWTTSESEVVRV